MGKDLKGKELGEGICQRKDGRYFARFTTCAGSRRQKYCKTAREAQIWLAKEREKGVEYEKNGNRRISYGRDERK